MSLNLTNIGWCILSHNGVSGCEHTGPECAECYAEAVSEMKRGTPAFPNGFDLTKRDNLRDLVNLKGRTLVFEGSMTDWWWKEIPDAWRHELFDAIEELGKRNPEAQILMLTKRTGSLLRWSEKRPIPGNVWIGCTYGMHSRKWNWNSPSGKQGRWFDLYVDPTLENRHLYDRIRQLKHVQGGRFLFVSCEPMLTPMPAIGDQLIIHPQFGRQIDWLIAGGMSGIKMWNPSYRRAKGLVEYVGGVWRLREDRISWLTDLRDECARVGTTYFYKQGGGPQPESAGHLLNGQEYVCWPDGKDWGAVKHPLLEAKAAAKARSKQREAQKKNPQLILDV